jgi:hypothetical protein
MANEVFMSNHVNRTHLIWHHRVTEAMQEFLHVDANRGLGEAELARRRERFGPNRLISEATAAEKTIAAFSRGERNEDPRIRSTTTGDNR